MGLQHVTGDEAADRVLRYMLASADVAPRAQQDDIRDGIQAMFFGWEGLAKRTELTQGQVALAVSRLAAYGYIRIETGEYRHGLHIWLCERSLAAA